MTNEQLTAYLQDDSYLYAVSYEELKTLVMQYPFATNLRILLLKKSFLEQNKDYDRNLQMAATFTTNRKYLYQVVQKVKSFKSAPQSVILGEDYLELTELSNIEKLLAEKQVSDALGAESRFDTLAADWQLEFGNLETAEEANSEPKIKGRDEEEIEMFELAFNAEIAENQTISNEEDLSYLIDNLVLEYNENEENQAIEDPSVSAAVEAELLDLFTPFEPDNIEEIKEEINGEIEEEKLELNPINSVKNKEIKIEKPISFFDLIQIEETKEMPQEIEEKTVELNTENKEEITEEEMDKLLSHSFKSIKKHEPDEFLATSFAVLNGENPEALEDKLAYSFIDEKDLSIPKAAPISEPEIEPVSFETMEEQLTINRLEEIEAILDKELTDKTLATSAPIISLEELVTKEEPIVEGTMEKKDAIASQPIIRKVIVKEFSEIESAAKAAVKLEKEITREAPSHSFRVIKKQLSQEVATNTFKVVVKEKNTSELNALNAENNAQLIDEIKPTNAPLIEEIAPINNVKLLEEIEPINADLIEEIEPINTVQSIEEIEPINDLKLIEELNPLEEIETVVPIPKHASPPQYVMDLEDVEHVSEQKTEKLSDDLEKIITQIAEKGTPQYKPEFEAQAPILDDKTDDLTESEMAKKSDIELEILNEHKVTIATKPTVELPPDSLSFTEWLRQYRMNQAAAEAQAAAVKTEVTLPKDDSEILDNQHLIEIDENRKTIKYNLDALFETENDVPENLFGLVETPEKKAKKNQDTEGVADIIRQHLTAEIPDETDAPIEKKKKKKKKEMHELAARSIEEDNEMVSETLADLLVWQGKISKAIDMYQKLSLAFPDKRTYFASKIETIKSTAA